MTMPNVTPKPLFTTLLCSAALLTGCNDAHVNVTVDAGPDDMGTIPVVDGCENVDPLHCLLPWPSSQFLTEDPETATGFRVDLPDDQMPSDRRGNRITRTETWERFDGFSPSTSIMAGFAGKLDDANLSDELHIADTLLPASQTLLLDATTGELVAHFAEIDKWDAQDRDTTTFYMRPATRLREDHRYIVAIRTGLRLMDGTTVLPSEYFRVLRDQEPTSVPEVEARRASMEDVFTRLSTAGVPRGELLLAWDFHTASGDSLRGDLLRMWADTKTRWSAGTDDLGECTVTGVENDVNDTLYRRVRGTFTVPLYMDTAEAGSRATRDASGQVMFNGTTQAPFEVAIPPSVRDRVMAGSGPARGIMHGHGLLGAGDQTSSGGVRVLLERSAMVGFGTDYWGLSEGDLTFLLSGVLTDFGDFDAMGERLMQGTINSLVLMKAFAPGGPCADLAELQIDVAGDLRPTLDADPRYYYGISQGGIMGGTLAALSDTIDAYVLQVGAVNYATLVRRSLDFVRYDVLMGFSYRRKLDRDWLVVSSQPVWSLAEPTEYVSHILRDALPGVDITNRRVLFQVSRYDTEVSNAASDMAARDMGLGALDSSAYLPWSVPVITENSVPSAFVSFWLDDVLPLPLGSVQLNSDNSAHGDLRYQTPVLDQIEQFARPGGTVVDTCPANSCLLDNERR
ncbi:MAG: hypothetical protein IPG81_31120 [Sandaracinaceae bacterium]|jgi:hypothetical protein|nr:hypothetical protein [Sandaracinaceae bacterium]